MGQTITQHATGNTVCPVISLAHIVHHILANGGTNDTLFCSYFANMKWHTVTVDGVVKQVRSTANAMKMETTGIDLSLIGVHSLCAEGVMALKLHGYTDTTIVKMGQWTLLTFLQYIHNQIAYLSYDISKKMSMELPFLNVAAIEAGKTEDWAA